jgi:hypothetical protein
MKNWNVVAMVSSNKRNKRQTDKTRQRQVMMMISCLINDVTCVGTEGKTDAGGSWLVKREA